MQLTSRERLFRAIRREEVDCVPVSPRLGDYLNGIAGCHCVAHHLDMADRFDCDLMIPYIPPQKNYLLNYHGPYNHLEFVKVDLAIENTPETVIASRVIHTPAGELRDRRVAKRAGNASVFDLVTEPLVKDESDIEKVKFLLPPPESAYIGDIPLLRKMIGDRGVLLASATQSAGQMLMDAIGVEQALILYHDNRKMLKETLRVFHEYHRVILKRILDQGVVKVIFDPWYSASISVGWSPEQFREVFLPLIRENVDLIHSHGAYVDYYDDGALDMILDDVASAGMDVIETLAPPPLGDIDLPRAKARVGHRVCFKGYVDQVNLICFGKPDQIREAVRTAIKHGAPGGGFILGTADSMRPESPEENVRAYFEAAREFGTFRG